MITVSRVPTSTPGNADLARLRRFAWLMDEGIRVPGTRFRIGLDPILGLVPGLGDAAGALLGSAILVAAIRQRVPKLTLVRMAANIGLDATLGSIPLIGDAFDAVWKSNVRNLDLLERHSAAPLEARRSDRLVVGSVFGVLLLLSIALVMGFAALIAAGLRLLEG